MLDTSELYEAVQRVFNDPKVATTDDLSKACRFCATDEKSVEAVESVKDLNASLIGLLTVSLEGRADDDDESVVDIRRARIALRTLVNALNRSKKFAGSVSVECLTLFRALIRIPDLHTETFAALVALARPMHSVCALSDAYTSLIGELVMLWESQSTCDSDRSWISALVSIHLEEDFGFLSSCFADFTPEKFTVLLHIIEVLMDSCHGEATTKTHPNNISFCVDFLQRVIFEFGQGLDDDRRSAYVEQVMYIVEILASAALRESEFSPQLLDRSEPVEIIVDVLDAVLDAEWLDENELKSEIHRSAHPDRPQRVPDIRSTRVQENRGLTALSAALRDSPMEIRANIKCEAVRAIGNLCSERLSLRRAAGARGAVLAVLRCARLTERDRPFIVQWSISALRHLCLECPENQLFILQMDQKPTGVIDRQKTP
ncbi:hypothetical protein KIN20_014052 [Parelaphostrongylus tenuis]|uniref:Ataxin-10 n=1 Tax=Parelaphostrongylus tenuis TaxID=148309 RepID=A0AAD5QRJ9_PARTN|nr:hypothetical protein KIN20_014052 [Parelaphostrongylus tenuis]